MVIVSSCEVGMVLLNFVILQEHEEVLSFLSNIIWGSVKECLYIVVYYAHYGVKFLQA